jgi:hypothetical protein
LTGRVSKDYMVRVISNRRQWGKGPREPNGG